MLHKINQAYKYLKIKFVWYKKLLPCFTMKHGNVKQNETFFLERNIKVSFFLFSFVPDFRC